MYKKLYGSALTLGASFVAMSSVSCSMVGSIPQNQFGYNSANAYFNVNSQMNPQGYGNQSCFSGSVALQNIGQVNNDLDDAGCSARFTDALNNFREVMRQASSSGGVKLADVSSVIVAQSRLIDVMSDVIASLLRTQQQQLGKSNEVKDLFTKLGDVFSSYSTSPSQQNKKSSQYIDAEIAKLQKELKKYTKNYHSKSEMFSDPDFKKSQEIIDKIAQLKNQKEKMH